MRRIPFLLYGFLVVLLLIVGCASVWFEFTPVAAIAETRSVALVASLAAIVLALVPVLRRKDSARWLWALAIVVGLGSAIWATVLLFFTYHQEDVRFRSGEVELAGTLYRPRSEGRHPAVVFLHGSGEQRRKEFAYHAKLFARHGIAALIYDKRGAGESTGKTYDTDYRGYAEDAAAAVRHLGARGDVRSGCVGVYGHSEGGWVASILGSEILNDLAFVIVSSTTPWTPAQQVLYETETQVRQAGFPPADGTRALALQRRVLEYQRSGASAKTLPADLSAASSEPWFQSAELPDELYALEEYAWWRGVMDFDSVPHWKRVRTAVLAISGGRDANSDVRVSQETIARALSEGGNRDFTGVIFPQMEHGGVEWWLPFRMPPPRFPRGLSELLVTWTGERVARCR